ncbi:TIGR04282 family arsenosugar biosynthesis glycosyltransferase [Synechocystis sp. CS-94]|nr:TIGR04282 family arsenosugar biosynthesis glycosyltransferase [Synechocystis sp. CS-94]
MTKQHLLIFTRWPEPGKTKTRLIAALGSEGAARLQQRLTEHTVQTAQHFCAQTTTPCQVNIFYTGATEQQMQQWLGSDFSYQAQGTGDLGDRLQQACQWAFAQGGEKVIIIGIDCPGITSASLQTAFTRLEQYLVVLGPALDGGYYLIGLTEFNPAYFQGIDWGTDKVYEQTLAKIQQNFSSDGVLLANVIYNLPTLADIDLPSDLKHLPETFAKTTGS